jgi:hypothetical protein
MWGGMGNLRFESEARRSGRQKGKKEKKKKKKKRE